MKALICVSEYYPYGSGIANVAYNVVEQMKIMGVECTICSPKCYKNKFGGLGLVYFWYKVSKSLQDQGSKYDIVWLHQPLFLLKRCPFKKAIITVHTTYIGKDNKKIKHSILKKIYYKFMVKVERFSYLRLPSSYTYTYIDNNILKELRNIGVKSASVFIPNGVDTNKFFLTTNISDVRTKFNIPSSHKLFLSVGRLISTKRPFLMLDIFKLVQIEYKEVSLLIVGDGNLANDVKKYAVNNNIQNVIFAGFVEHDLLPTYYSCADYYIMTSEYEGQPLTLLEAMASGLPCIVSNIPNFKIVRDANCGIILDFSNNDTAVSEILNFIKKDNSENSINARRYVVENLDWSIIAEKYFKECKKLL